MTTDSTAPDPYEVLGVSTDASQVQIRKAWRKRTASTGPGTPQFAALNAAAELLLDSDRRKAYDGERAAARLAQRATVPSQAPAPAPSAEPEAPPGIAATDGAPTPRVRRALTGWSGTVAIAGVLAVIALALALWQGIEYANRSTTSPGPGTGGVAATNFVQPQSTQDAVISAVQTGLPAVLSYNYASMAASEANGARFLVPSARAGFAATFQRIIKGGAVPGCKSSLPPIATRKTVVAATVVDAGIVSVTATTAQVGAFVNQTTTSAGQAPVTTQNRVLVTLAQQGGSWLIQSLTVPNSDHVLHC